MSSKKLHHPRMADSLVPKLYLSRILFLSRFTSLKKKDGNPPPKKKKQSNGPTVPLKKGYLPTKKKRHFFHNQQKWHVFFVQQKWFCREKKCVQDSQSSEAWIPWIPPTRAPARLASAPCRRRDPRGRYSPASVGGSPRLPSRWTPLHLGFLWDEILKGNLFPRRKNNIHEIVEEKEVKESMSQDQVTGFFSKNLIRSTHWTH